MGSRSLMPAIAVLSFTAVGFLDPSQRVDPKRLVEYEQQSESPAEARVDMF